MLREPSKLFLGENQFPIFYHFKISTTTLDEFYSDMGEAFFYLCLQTGGLRIIVSNYTVFNGDSHLFLSFESG